MLYRTMKKSECEPEVTSPIAFRACSNGEHMPAAETERDRRAVQRFAELATRLHRRAGMTRRQFVESACGAAAALTVINELYGCASKGDRMRGTTPEAPGPRDPSADAGFGVSPDMMVDPELACTALEGDEFVLDVQMHPPNPLSPWTDRPLSMDAETFIQVAFIDSETTVGVLSGIPSTRDLGLPNVEANLQLREIVERIGGPRLILHANLKPDRGGSELDYMEEVLAARTPSAWKVYPHVGSWRLDSQEVGLPFVEKARALGVPLIAAHRGIASDAGDYASPSSPIDLVMAAKSYPDVRFLTYHSGWQGNVDENHAFDPDDPNPRGVDRLVKAVIDQGLGQTGNVYAELGSTWRNLMTQPDAAAHVLGKLLQHVGEERVIWGTDSVFTGSPREQIVAFRAFEIPLRMQEEHGYPALTPAIKAKVLGLNAAPLYGIDPAATRCAIAGDFVEQLRAARRADPRAVPLPREKSYGPRTRREFLAFERFERAFDLG
jgi:predicted TIM-barrel fold metal-dependent hydrolase